MKKGKNQHVVTYGDQYAVRGEGNEKVTKIFDKQSDAIEFAKDIAKNQGSEMLVHGRDGKIRMRNSYGNDPFPPIG